MRDVYVVGVHTIQFGKYLEHSVKDLAAMTFKGCLEDAGLEKDDIQALWFSNSGWGDKGQACIRGQVALRHIGLDKIPITNVENACASASTALHNAWMGVGSGLYDVAMALGAEKLYHSNRAAVFAGFLGGIDIENCADIVEGLTDFQLNADDLRQMKEFQERYAGPNGSDKKSKRKPKLPARLKGRAKDLWDNLTVAIRLGEAIGYDKVRKLAAVNSGDHSPFMDVYGFAARQHMKQFGSTVEQLAVIASKNHFNSTLNPNAQYRFEVSVDQVLADRLVTWPLTRSMCAPIGDGAASAIVCSGPMVRKLGLQKQAVKIRASVLGSGMDRPHGFDQPEIGERLSKIAYEKAGVGPEEISLAEVHDATAYGEMRQAENLGFCPIGEGGIFAESGATKLDGQIPINTSGGLTSRGHPIGASGLAQIHELTVQLRGQAGDRQINNPKLGLAENGGGALGAEEAAMCIHILEAPST
ncbi:Thiolase, C-terminal domain [Desulfatibacillum alkenivorans DSM 16219]|jgi:acetyl-CoA acetyltransferase|uniref:Thiolase, C-terminal domain n=1 Tax=Desulfatibacillum alkenivorans DSM 16219 TaxID=1121393 RepID=A0A1M6FG03_9BACT|nr:thiolase family protein [Desulfatibacillum alkenivorans]SHI96589.1 Thiolase, C-terminal domain [Desulfatibacillum alkenivorans DSM 16219]